MRWKGRCGYLFVCVWQTCSYCKKKGTQKIFLLVAMSAPLFLSHLYFPAIVIVIVVRVFTAVTKKKKKKVRGRGKHNPDGFLIEKVFNTYTSHSGACFFFLLFRRRIARYTALVTWKLLQKFFPTFPSIWRGIRKMRLPA